MNIEEIKRKVNGSGGVGQYCYHPDGFYGDRQLNADDDVLYLLSIIEQVENAFINVRDRGMENAEDSEYVDIADEALKAIRGN